MSRNQVPPQDVLCASITLERAVDGFPPGTVHLAVVDPGVGTRRRLLAVAIKRQLVVCPDNGLITWTWRRHGGPQARAYELLWRPARTSRTFHGRDIMAPVAGMLARGEPVAGLAAPISDPVLLDVAPVSPTSGGRIIHIDHFGDATTNIGHESLASERIKEVRVNGRSLGRLRRTYHDVAPGKPLALIGSSGLLEIAVRDGSAASDLHLRVGDAVVIR